MATRTFRGATDSNWGTAGNWLEGAVPTNADDVVFDASSPNCTINASARVAKTITFSAYTNTITFSQTLTVSGSVTLGASMSFAGASALIIDATSTITSNGKTLGVPLTITTAGVTITITGDLTVSGTATIGAGTEPILNGSRLICTGNLSVVGNGGFVGNSTVVLAGNTTWSRTAAGIIGTHLEINAPGNTVTLSGNVGFGSDSLNKTFTYTAGTIVQTGTLFIGNTAGTTTQLDLDGATWGAIEMRGGTHTLLSALVSSSTLSYNVGTGTSTVNGFTVTCASLSVPSITTGTATGTTEIILNGTGTISMNASVTTGTYRNPITVSSANVTLSGTFRYQAGTFQLNNNLLGSGILLITTSATIAGNGNSLQNITLSGGAGVALSISSLVVISGTLDISASGNVTFSGAAGWTAATFKDITAGHTHTLAAGVTYTVTSSIILTAINGSSITLQSSSGTVKAILTMSGSTQEISHVNATRIDSSAGNTIYSYYGSITDSLNWNAFTSAPRTVAHVF